MARGVLLDGVVAELRQLGEQATAAELPLTGLHADVAAARSPIEAAGPASAVIGHSYGGTVIMEAAAGLTGVCPGAVLRSIRWPRPRSSTVPPTLTRPLR
jgi:pimeloyl-ACP methyl ester carboxylesterase